MPYKIFLTTEAKEEYESLKTHSQKGLFTQIKKAIKLLGQNPRHPSLQTHPYQSISGPNNEKIFEAYAQNKTPSAYRLFWHYGPEKDQITIIAITPHP